ncbi:hypothetical protein [Nannocystis pusilla]|uniref:hypothetical protein n=1 Tax=Nannocystis pusilla TaxID=889268 RepID=UPI003B7BC4CD
MRLSESTLTCDSGVWNCSVTRPWTTLMSLGASSSTRRSWYETYSLASCSAVMNRSRPMPAPSESGW